MDTEAHAIIDGVGFFYCTGGYILQEFDKPFKTYDEQIALLRKRNLIINDYDFAIHALDTISYYDLINRYQKHFIPNGKTFIKNTTIEQLYSLSMFDRSIQMLIMKYSMFVENLFKTKLAYTLSRDFGVDMPLYLSASKYRQTYKDPNRTLTFNDVITECIKTRDDPKITNNPTLYYRNHHNHIPPWILLKNLSFSNSINLFKLLKNSQRDDVVQALLPDQANTTISLSDKTNFAICTLEAIRTFRNYAAHNLDFTALRTDETRKIPPSILSKYFPGGLLIKKTNKKILSAERSYLRGVYGIMLAIMVLLKTDYLKQQLILDFVSLFIGSDAADRSIKPYLFNCYANIANMPIDTLTRLQNYYNEI